MSGLTRERGAAVIGLLTFHPVLSSLLYLPPVQALNRREGRVVVRGWEGMTDHRVPGSVLPVFTGGNGGNRGNSGFMALQTLLRVLRLPCCLLFKP